MITELKNALSEFRFHDNNFEVIYDDILKVCTEFNIEIPKVRKQIILSRVNPNEEIQHFIESKKEEINYFCYFVILDKTLIGLNSRFNHETLNIISAIGNLMYLTSSENGYICLLNTFDFSVDKLKSEIRLIINILNTELSKG